MVYRTEIKIKPADLTDLTVTTDLSSWNLEQFTIEDNALIGYISATDNITISSTGYITQTIAFSDIPPTIYLIPSNEVETLSDGTNDYPVADKMARLMLEDKADISDIPTKTSDLNNDSGYITSSALTPYVLSSDLAAVATTGNYNDLSDTPTIPTVNNATLTIQKNGSDIGAFTANQSTDEAINITVPTKTSDITNDSGYITSADLPTNYVTTDTTQTITGAKTFANTTIIDLGATSSASLTVKGSGTNQAFLLQRTNGATGILEAGATIVLFGSKTNHPLHIRTNYATRMTIGTDGSVILATAPSVSSNNNQVATTKWVNDKGYITNSALDGYATESYVDNGVAAKQDTLVSGTNIKTINNESILGSGNIDIQGGGAVDSVNGQTGDVVLTASDVGALPSSTSIPTKTSDLDNDSGFITGISSSDVTTALGYTPADDSDVVKLTGNQTVGGTKNFKSGSITVSKSNMTKGTNPSSNLYWQWFSGDKNGAGDANCLGKVVTSVESNGNVHTSLVAYKNATGTTNATIGIHYPTTGDPYTSCPASTEVNSIVTTTARTVADGGCTFVLGNGLKIITTEVTLTAATDYSWSYGTTFTNTPKIFTCRRSGSSTTAGIYDAWVRGSVGKSSSNIYSASGGTFMLTVIGN